MFCKRRMFKQERGFSLIELFVSIGIMSFLVAMSAPSYTAWMANSRVRGIAENINFGIMQARAEAVRRNQEVEFQVSADTSWQVRVVSSSEVINKKAAHEQSGTTAISMLPSGASTITFNGYGLVTANLDSSAGLRGVNVRSTSTYSGVRPLRVQVGAGGASFVCDPSVSSAADARYCR